MRTKQVVRVVWMGCVMLGLSALGIAQSGSPGASVATDGPGGTDRTGATDGTPIIQLIEGVAKRTNKNFVVDPRVTGNARVIGFDVSRLSYAELLTILQVYGYAAVESGNIVRIIPAEESRHAPTPLLKGNDKRLEAEYVTKVIRVKSVPAAQLVPIMRSLLPRSAQLAAVACTNELLIVDTFANVQRIEALVAEMDKGEPLTLEKCEHYVPRPQLTPGPAAPQGRRPPPR